jgi:DedD protein
MDQNTKQRLVGISVIFALAVIFLPMILDGSGVKNETLTVNIPPSYPLDENTEFEQKIVELHANVDDLPTIQSGVIDEQSSLIGKMADELVVALSETDKSNSDQTEVKAEPIASKAVAATSVKTTTVKKKSGGDSFVLQVGSFKDQSKAILQRDTLRKSKIAAVFIEKFTANSSPSYRVRLGPFVSRKLSKIAQNKIKAKYNINGLIMVYE